MKIVRENIFQGPYKKDLDQYRKKIGDREYLKQLIKYYADQSFEEIIDDIKRKIPNESEDFYERAAFDEYLDLNYILDNINDYLNACSSDYDYCINNTKETIAAYSNAGDPLEYKV